ncbi:hypothetical protein DGG96_03655 [Legionella qingyii]|uniref:Uncharacterized protein n=1 Tax=Legionella qingyii TaxID=2184757 RepID=A0A317U527_9GAMM|nr:hypothetical protein DGG96_03655 [Legionella qingyii]
MGSCIYGTDCGEGTTKANVVDTHRERDFTVNGVAPTPVLKGVLTANVIKVIVDIKSGRDLKLTLRRVATRVL